MEHDICDFLSYEVKKELAEQYFGFRKLIEADKETLHEKIRQQERLLLQEIGFDLVRIYILLRDETLIKAFLRLTGLEEEIFFDPYFLESETIKKKVFAGRKCRGLTRSGKFKRLLMDCYESLESHVASYREQYVRLLEERQMIKEEIDVFHRKHDITCILDFLRKLDYAGKENVPAVEPGGDERGEDSSISSRMRISPPEPLENILIMIPPVTPLPRIRNQLRSLAEQAFQRNDRQLPLP
jgi:hypothetical protein